MRLESFSTISADINAIVTTNTAQYLSAAHSNTSIPCRAVSVQASSTNVSAIGVGPAGVVITSSGYPIQPGTAISLDVDNLNKIQVVGTATDIVAWIAVGVDINPDKE